MMSRKLWLTLLLATACAKSAPSSTSPAVIDPVPMNEHAEHTPAATPATAVLAAYEKTRALLAADEMTGLAEAARELDASAAKAQYPQLAATAGKLAMATDIEAARESFGEVSRELVVILAKDPALAKGQHVYECPMVKGYRKWVQPSEDMENPYMGKKMLACGGESTWD
jgi:Cu(I)/Ag(I) efflux system membrane fusion protein